MLSLVSCVCLGMYPGMWVVNIGIYLGVQVRYFILVLLSQHSDCLKWAAPLGCVCFVLVKLRFRGEWMILKSSIYTGHEHLCLFRIGVSYPPPTHPPIRANLVWMLRSSHILYMHKYHCDEIKQGLKGYCHELGSVHTTVLDLGKCWQDRFTYTVLSLSFHWSPLICTSIVFRDRGIVMSQSLLFSQPVTNNLSNGCRSPQQDKGFDCYLGKRDSSKFGQEMWIGKENDFWDINKKSSECGFLHRKEWEWGF